jgi:arabinose-5-phosphate isomerase
VPELIYEMNRKGLGMSCVVDSADRLLGIVTDGDLRRHMGRGSRLLEATAADVMTAHPVTVGPDVMAVEVLNVLEARRITSVVVVDGETRVLGVVHLHDLWRTELV